MEGDLTSKSHPWVWHLLTVLVTSVTGRPMVRMLEHIYHRMLAARSKPSFIEFKIIGFILELQTN